ncbi:LexA family transcriptional regulator [Treponema denticola]|uniref:LexA family transcriptional regulator n=1 Tax=Treponema denticola TaxID=158 RepID=UPI0020A60FD0|nr:LexA family transcriptional regulator [Treponema denticola]UTC82685.1 hypothetical protein HGJ18_05495 [Treponema denticola]
MENIRLKEIRQALGLNQLEMARKFDKTQSLWSYYEKGIKPIQSDVYIKLQEMGFNIEWLKNGIGSMYLKDKMPIVKNAAEAEKKDLIPFYDIDVTAHISEIFTDTPHSAPAYWLDIPHFKGSIACRVSGDSMAPEISSGDMILVKKINNPDVILWGEIYLVVTDETANNLCTIKKLYQGRTPDTLILRSINPEYAGDTLIPKQSILTIAHVIGCVKMF